MSDPTILARRLIEAEACIDILAGRVHLSRREIQVLRLVTTGLSTKEAANELGISIKTVEAYRASLMEKFAVHDVVRLTHCAIRTNFIRK